MCRSELSAVIAQLISKCEASGGGSGELKKCPPPFPSVLRFVNGREKNPDRKKKKIEFSIKFNRNLENFENVVTENLKIHWLKFLSLFYQLSHSKLGQLRFISRNLI